MSTSIAQPTVIKEFVSLEDAQTYIQTNPDATPFVFYVTGSAKIYYSNLTNGGGSPNYVKILNSVIDGTSESAIDIPETVTTIRPFAFYKCYGLQNITIPNSVVSIGNSAFRNTGLQSVEIPDTVTQYYNNTSGYQFQGDTSLTYVKYFPAGLMTAFPTYEFAGCTELTTVDIDTEGYTSIGANAFQNCSSLTTIPSFESVTSIGNYAFAGCSSISNSPEFPACTTIGQYAFQTCTNLNAPKFPNVTTVNTYGFAGCSNMNAEFGVGKITVVQARGFESCAKQETVDLSNISATGIHYRAFNGCTSLKNVTIREGVTTLPSYAFNNCKSITSITLPSTMTAAGFTNGSNVSDNDNGRRAVFANCTSLTSFTLLSTSCVSFPQYYLQNCTSLTNSGITLPDSITTFQGYCFQGCTSLTKPVYRNTSSTDNTLYGTYCFSGCTGITDLAVPAGQTSFAGTYLFNGCTGLTSVTLPSNLLTIPERCFNGCTNMTYFKAEGLTSLAKSAFFGCSKLVTVDLPATCTEFTAAANNNGTFQNCSSMTTLILRSTTVMTGINAYTFQGIKTNGKIYVPQGMLASYQAVAAWYSTNSNYYPKKMGWTLNELDASGNIPS